ncbi:bile acid:sodium symporter [Conexibacter sp. DBS9H8]|uniref:bile acid:sodium symporter n=1 Tax=Conexibacter sp. DBS9H8 TaxID=2937801 RepID=UPI00200F42F9|nr:bile acid:sodium symporter [Conexibacter sp. DBS9H8]
MLPLFVLGFTGWALGRPFSPAVQHGLLGTGLSSAEVASVGLVGLASADATIALGVVTGSLVASAVLSPIAIGLLSPGTQVNGSALLGRFGLVVIAPLILGVAVRSARHSGAWLAAHDESRDGLGALTVVALVYAALSGAHGAHGLASATLAGALFLALSAGLAAAWSRLARRWTGRGVRVAPGRAGTERRGGDLAAGGEGDSADLRVAVIPGAFTIAMRDFAVAATLATQAFGSRAGTVPGIYGVLMLIGGSLAAVRLRGRAPESTSFPRAAPEPSPRPPR